LHWPIENLKTRALPATDEAIARFEQAFGRALPRDYVDFLKTANGGEGTIGAAYIRLWGVEDIIRLNHGYAVQEFLPGLLVFASNGGGGAFAFDTRHDPWIILRIEFAAMLFEDTVRLADSFTEFILRLAQSETLRPDKSAKPATGGRSNFIEQHRPAGDVLEPSTRYPFMGMRIYGQPSSSGRESRTGVLHRDTLRKSLDRGAEQNPHVVELAGGPAGSLFVGVGLPYGAVEHHSADAGSQVRVAIDDPEAAPKAIPHVRFESVHGVIAIPPRFCLPFEAVKNIAVYFYDTRTCSPTAQWETIPASFLCNSNA